MVLLELVEELLVSEIALGHVNEDVVVVHLLLNHRKVDLLGALVEVLNLELAEGVALLKYDFLPRLKLVLSGRCLVVGAESGILGLFRLVHLNLCVSLL